MKKEVLVAILVGFIIGLIITFGIYQAQKMYLDPQTISETLTPPQETSNPDDQVNAHELRIVSPQDNEIMDSKTISITGFTTPLSYVTVVSDFSEASTQASNAGSFTVDIELDELANVLTLTSITETGQITQESITITYLLDNTNQTENEDE